MDKLLTVTELAEAFSVTPRTIRFYETKGLISPQRVGSTRVYTYRDRARLKLILRAKRLGFSLMDIREYLDLYNVDPEQIEQQRLLLAKVTRRIEELEQQQEDLAATLDELRDIEQQAMSNIKKKSAAMDESA
ncbi:MerR family transcriptional regulator [Sedimenticola thiotaurini]|uniref:MerR family transcriptional regulator n=1 Tax=Sedimenticola thiotaurini TaxID=1543721 RepID=A0A0F7JUQ3_9GAMM|nr:MerR family DNA-binding transcriptional regulator [Sedimenticola thiotaurini]AKH19332.1 MerR family transcriptional regulator [Sedimenticola thiotaurini]